MNRNAKIFAIAALIGGAFGLNKLIKAAGTGKKVSVNLASLDPPKIQSGSVILSVHVVCDNPTNHTLSLKKPNIKVFYNDKEVGNSIPSNERIPIKANDRTTIKGINIQVPFLKLGSLALALVSGKKTKMAFDIEMSTEADGIPYTDKQHFDL